MSRYFKLADPPAKFRYLECMKVILKYLHEHGTIYCTEEKIEELWKDFSEYSYCASYLEPDNDSLREFANWLNDIED